jgi:hypothetical protein
MKIFPLVEKHAWSVLAAHSFNRLCALRYSPCGMRTNPSSALIFCFSDSMINCAIVGILVPMPPLTSGSILLVPEGDLVKLDMSVVDGIKFIMSLGSVSPVYLADTFVECLVRIRGQ